MRLLEYFVRNARRNWKNYISFILYLQSCNLHVFQMFRYASSATPRDFEIYAPDASFEDPLMCARGYVYKEIAILLALFSLRKNGYSSVEYYIQVITLHFKTLCLFLFSLIHFLFFFLRSRTHVR